MKSIARRLLERLSHGTDGRKAIAQFKGKLTLGFSVTVVVAICAAGDLAGQTRWLVVLEDALGTVVIDTTRLQHKHDSVWRIWGRNSSNVLSLYDLDCATLRMRTILTEERVRGTPQRQLVPPLDSLRWFYLPPDSRGEASARATCRFLETRSIQRSRDHPRASHAERSAIP